MGDMGKRTTLTNVSGADVIVHHSAHPAPALVAAGADVEVDTRAAESLVKSGTFEKTKTTTRRRGADQEES